MKTGQLRIDLNCDMGEFPEAIADGTQEALLLSITSANVACGGHAGDAEMMRATIEQAMRAGVAIGASRVSGPREFRKARAELIARRSCRIRVRAGSGPGGSCGDLWCPSGARKAAWRALQPGGPVIRELAQAIAAGVARWSRDVVLVGLAGSPMLDVFREAGFRAAAEAFADRRYEPDGTLRSRKSSWMR